MIQGLPGGCKAPAPAVDFETGLEFMRLRIFSTISALASACIFIFLAGAPGHSGGQTEGKKTSQSSSSSEAYAQEKTPSLIDPAGPTVSLISAEPVFLVAAALNTCGYDEALDESQPIRQRVRDEIQQALKSSERARASRDALCLYIAQHRLTGTVNDISQYISLSLYLTSPPEVELTAELTEMPPDATQVAEIVPLLKEFAAAVDLNGIWLTARRTYDEETNQLHDPLTKMIVAANLYLKLPASSYEGQRFIVVVEPLLSPGTVNARIYGLDYVVVVSPSRDGSIHMTDVRHTYLHYVIDPLLYARTNAIDREQPILKEIRNAPLEYRFRSDVLPLTIECLIKAIEARTMDTGIPVYKIPAGVDRSELPRYQHQLEQYQQKVDAVKMDAVRHDNAQGFVLTQYFYEQLIPFEKDPASLKDTIGEMVYSMDVEDQVKRARNTTFDKEADADVLQRSKPRKLTGLDLAEARLAAGDTATAAAMARQVLVVQSDTVASVADAARAEFILARVEAMSGHPEQAIDDFQKTLATSKEARLVSWSHIYLGRMMDLDCKRDQAVAQYQLALETRDGEQDTRLAAERGLKTAYAVKGHTCDEDSDDDAPAAQPSAPGVQGRQPSGKP